MRTSLNNPQGQSPHIHSIKKSMKNLAQEDQYEKEKKKQLQTSESVKASKELKDNELTNILNQKRKELESLNNQLASSNPIFYELVKQYENTSSQKVVDEKQRASKIDYKDKKVKPGEHHPPRKEERQKNYDHSPQSKSHQPKPRATPNKDVKFHKEEHIPDNFIKLSVGEERFHKDDQKEDMFEQDNKKRVYHDKENTPPSHHHKKQKAEAFEDNRVNITDISGHHTAGDENIRHKLKNQESKHNLNHIESDENSVKIGSNIKNKVRNDTDSVKIKRNLIHSNENVSPHKDLKSGKDEGDNSRKNKNPKYHDAYYRNPEIEKYFDAEQVESERSPNDFKIFNEKKFEPRFENSNEGLSQSQNNSFFIDKMQEEAFQRAEQKRMQIRKYSEELKKQMEEKEEDKRREKEKKKLEERLTEEERQREVERALKKVEQSSFNQPNVPDLSQIIQQDIPFKQHDQSLEISSYSQLSNRNFAPGWNPSYLSTSPPMLNVSEVPFGVQGTENIPNQEILLEKLLEEKLQLEKLALQEQMIYAQYQNKIKDLELEKIRCTQEMERVKSLLSNCCPPNNFNMPSPITQKLSIRSGSSRSPIKPHEFNANEPPKGKNNNSQIQIKNQNEKAEISSVEQSLENSLPSTHYQYQISEKELEQSFQKDLRILQQLQDKIKMNQNKSNGKKETDNLTSEKGKAKQINSNLDQSTKNSDKDNLVYQIDNMGIMMTPTVPRNNIKKMNASSKVEYDKSPSVIVKIDSDEESPVEENQSENRLETFQSLKQETGKFPVYYFNVENEPNQKGPVDLDNKKERESEKLLKTGKIIQEDEKKFQDKIDNTKGVIKEEEKEAVIQKLDDKFNDVDETESIIIDDPKNRNMENTDKSENYTNKQVYKTKSDSCKGSKDLAQNSERMTKQSPQEKAATQEDMNSSKEDQNIIKDFYKIKSTTEKKPNDPEPNLKLEKGFKSVQGENWGTDVPQQSSSYRASPSSNKFRSPKIIDPFQKETSSRSQSLYSNFSEKMKESTKINQKGINQSECGTKDEANSKGQLGSDKKDNSKSGNKVERTIEDSIQVEQAIKDIEEEEKCFQEYDKQFNNSRQRALWEKQVVENLIKEHDAGSHEMNKDSTKTGYNNKLSENKKENTPEKVIEFQTGNWEDLRWDSSQKEIEKENEKVKTPDSNKKRSQVIVEKLEKLLDDWKNE